MRLIIGYDIDPVSIEIASSNAEDLDWIKEKPEKARERELVGSGAAHRSKEAVGMMALHEALRSICLNSDWTYSVFWTIHPRLLVVGDGFVTITRGDSITRFFEHADEAEEEEDDDSMYKDGNELDGECSHLQKHASPELARIFLLDAATVILRNKLRKLLEKEQHGKMHTSLCV
ncbi:hypothetical protein ACS0TY_013299 [Phlomoides rotata]